MSRGRHVKNKTVDKMFIAIVAALIIVVAILLIVLRANANRPDDDAAGGNITASGNTDGVGSDITDSPENGDTDSGADSNVESSVGAGNTGGNTETESGNSNANTGNSNADTGNGNSSTGGNTGNGNNNTSGNNNDNNNNSNNDNNSNDNNDNGSNNDGDADDGDEENDNSGNTTGGGDITVSQPNIEITERADADYEQWLAATMVVCISMEYPDFELDGIYTASETSFENKFSSDGTYIVFTSGGKTMAVHSVALSGERTASGTRDISSQTLGFATFDVVSPSSVNTSSMTEISVDDLDELIEQSLLISVYTH
ncbi:MAG: hypothetical protein IJ017_00660 [Oscillospiraceae bacterium]|nr:hypothetical protein [Oscillospiraceae bacterium]